jgi:hypothetical protein
VVCRGGPLGSPSGESKDSPPRFREHPELDRGKEFTRNWVRFVIFKLQAALDLFFGRFPGLDRGSSRHYNRETESFSHIFTGWIPA